MSAKTRYLACFALLYASFVYVWARMNSNIIHFVGSTELFDDGPHILSNSDVDAVPSANGKALVLRLSGFLKDYLDTAKDNKDCDGWISEPDPDQDSEPILDQRTTDADDTGAEERTGKSW